jgi:hypothetical protein
MKRSGQQRLEAMPVAVQRADEFKARVKAAEGDAVKCADLMAEAIQMHYEANGIGTVGNDGRVFVEMESLAASWCLIDAREAYLRARGSNQPHF